MEVLSQFWPVLAVVAVAGIILWLAINYGRLAEREETQEKLLEVKKDAGEIDQKTRRLSALDKRRILRRHRDSGDDI